MAACPKEADPHRWPVVMRYLTDQELTRLEASHPEIAEGICPTCRNKGTYTWRKKEYECDCREQKQLNKLYFDAGIGLPYQRKDWDDLIIPRERFTPINDYVANPERFLSRGIGLLITGPNGTGKTLIANLILKQLVREDYRCYFTTASGMVTEFTAGWNNDNEKHRFAQKFMKTNVLCLDDLGKEFKSSNKLSATTFDHILRTRVHNGLATILTTNLDVNELRRGYGGAVLSLLMEQSMGVHIEGGDFRAQVYDRNMSEAYGDEVRPIT
jgi:DNA replication protein DnaC